MKIVTLIRTRACRRWVWLGLVLLTTLACVDEGSQHASSATSPCVEATAAPTLAHAITSPEILCRIRILGDALAALAPSEAGAVWEFVDAKLWLIDDPSLGVILRWQTQIDPLDSFEHARRFHGSRRAVALGAVLERWAEIDPRAAANALESMPLNRRAKNQSLAVAQGWEASGQPGLDVFIAGLESTKARHSILADILMRIATRDGSAEMLRWVESLPEDLPNGLNRAAYRFSAAALARIDLDQARQWVEAAPVPVYRPSMVRAVAVRWVLEDPSAAMAWVSATLAGEERDEAIHETYRTFSHHDQKAANAWFDAQPYADWLEPVLAYRLAALARTDGSAAIEQVDRIQDESRRQTTIVAILRRWRLQDRAAADVWVASADLPPETRKRLEPRMRRSRSHSDADPD